MSNQIHYTLCPVCGSAGISEVFNVKDNTVSQEYFEIYHCRNCQVRFTQNPPSETSIGAYYKSEDYISHTDSSKGLINRMYRFVRNFSLNQKKKLVEKETGLKNGHLLDVRSGTGHFASAMQKAAWKVTGLEHDVKKYIQTFKKLLTDTGRLFRAVPNYTSYDAEKYKEYWAAYDVPRHLYHFAPQTMQWLMKECRLKVIAVKPMWFDSFYVSLLSSKYKNGNTKWVGAFWTGLISNFKAMNDVKKCSSVIYIISK